MDSATLENLHEIAKGDIITLRDFNTLEGNGDEYEGAISEAYNWKLRHNDFSYTMYGFRVEVNDEVTLMLVVRSIPSQDLNDYRLFRLWDENRAIDCDFITKSWEPMENFSLDFGDEENPDEWDYVTKPSYPCYDATNNGKKILMTEYAVLGDCDINFFAKHGLLEWYAYVGENGEEGLVTMWLGWEVGEDDFSIIKSN